MTASPLLPAVAAAASLPDVTVAPLSGAVSAAAESPPLAATELSRTISGVTVGLTQPWFLLALPIALAVLWWLVFRSSGGASARSRRLLVLSRTLVVVALVVAAAGPYTEATRETTGDPRVTLLADRSDSTAVSPAVTDDLAESIEAEGVPVTTATIADGTSSRVGDGVAANLRENGSLVLVSDGQVTGGRSLAAVAETAASLNATVSSVAPAPTSAERYVALHGPSKTSVGVENTFLARVDGANLEGRSATLTVTVDGERALQRAVEGSTAVEFGHAFNETGSHRVTAQVSSGDEFAVNDVYRKTVRVVERPKILYVSRGEYLFEEYLGQLYDVETAESVPSDLEPYYAVVVQDMPAGEVGDVEALQRFVIDGNGLLAVGGDNAFDRGGYRGSAFGSMLPVSTGESSPGSTNLVLVIDVSGSSKGGMRVQKSIALDVLDQLGGENRVGIVGFNHRAYRVADLAPLSENRGQLEDRIRRLESGGATSVAAGLNGAGELLGEESGSVILISDGRDEVQPSTAAAAGLRSRGIRVVSVGTGGNPKEETLRAVARLSGGTYLRANETSRLRLLFGGGSRQFEGDSLTIVNRDAFVTSGVTLTADPGQANDVSVRRGAEYLVATGDGTPAVATWRFGLGRVATVTAYGNDGTLDGLLERPDSLLMTKTTNYVIGDPERKAEGVTEVADARVGEATAVTYRGQERPDVESPSFRAVGEGTYRASVTPDETGYHDVLGTEYAANYPREYGGFGPSSALSSLVTTTGGREFQTGQAAEIASFAREQSTRVRTVRDEWTWLFLAVGLAIYVVEVLTRRLQVYTGKTRNEGGLI